VGTHHSVSRARVIIKSDDLEPPEVSPISICPFIDISLFQETSPVHQEILVCPPKNIPLPDRETSVASGYRQGKRNIVIYCLLNNAYTRCTFTSFSSDKYASARYTYTYYIYLLSSVCRD